MGPSIARIERAKRVSIQLAGAQPGFLRAGEVLAKRGHIDIVSTWGATMVGAEGKIFGIWTLQIGLKCPSQALFRGKVTFKIRDFCLFLTLYYKEIYYREKVRTLQNKKRAQLLNIFSGQGRPPPSSPGCAPGWGVWGVGRCKPLEIFEIWYFKQPQNV